MHIDALSVLCAQLTHDLLAMAKFLFITWFWLVTDRWMVPPVPKACSSIGQCNKNGLKSFDHNGVGSGHDVLLLVCVS